MKSKFTVNDVFRVTMAMMDCCMMDENVQVNGLVVFVDASNFTIRHAEKVFGVENMKKAVNIWTVSSDALTPS